MGPQADLKVLEIILHNFLYYFGNTSLFGICLEVSYPYKYRTLVIIRGPSP